MLHVSLDEEKGIATLEPNGELSESDFITATKLIDPYIDNFGELKGLVILVESFPGWDSFSSLIAHLKFVREHHKKVARIAFVTNSPIGSIAENIAKHFVNAQIRNFDFEEEITAKQWIAGDHD